MSLKHAIFKFSPLENEIISSILRIDPIHQTCEWEIVDPQYDSIGNYISDKMIERHTDNGVVNQNVFGVYCIFYKDRMAVSRGEFTFKLIGND